MAAHDGRPQRSRHGGPTMSGAAPPLPGAWAAARELDLDARLDFYEQGKALDQEIRANRRAIRLGGYAVGAAGLLVGIAGMGAAALMLPLKTTETSHPALRSRRDLCVAARLGHGQRRRSCAQPD